MLEVKRKASSPSQGKTGGSATSSPAEGARSSSLNRSAALTPANKNKDFQTKIPAINGEVHFKGVASIEGVVSGQVGAGNGLNIRQKCSASIGSRPELNGEITFKDMVRVNGHIAGTVFSEAGTLIVDTGAQVDASVDVAVALISGTVTGDIVAREKVELGPSSKISGNIWTRSITIRDGAIFEGVCRMLDEKVKAG